MNNHAVDFWDKEAATFDLALDHGLASSEARAAWEALLKKNYPSRKNACIDLGCGTGSLSLLLSKSFHRVAAIDFSSEMIRLAKDKGRNTKNIDFQTKDAFDLGTAEKYDFILCRHLLWLSKDLAETLAKWMAMLEPNGKLLLVEGFWHTNVGLKAESIEKVLATLNVAYQTEDISPNHELWGQTVADERYAICIERLPAA